MRIRVFDADDLNHGGLHDLETEVIPSVGDIISMEYGDGSRQAYEVTSRVLRVKGDDAMGDIFFVAVAARKVDDRTGLLRYCI